MQNFTMSLIANYIALAVLIAKTFFDLVLNRWIFDKSIEKGEKDLVALKKRNDRGNWSSTAAFAAMSISIMLAIGGTMSDDNTSSNDTMKTTLLEHATRIQKIENTIWPPETGGDYGSPVPPDANGPWDPVGMQTSLNDIKKQLAELEAKGSVTDDRLDTLIRIVNQLTEKVEDYEKTVKQLEKIMAVPVPAR